MLSKQRATCIFPQSLYVYRNIIFKAYESVHMFLCAVALYMYVHIYTHIHTCDISKSIEI